MKKITVKRFAMTSTAVLLSLSLLNTAPGVHIGVKPLSVVHASDTTEIKSQLADIFTIINADSTLKSAYDTASGHIDTAVDAVDSSVLVKLKANNSGISGTQLAALRTLLNEAISYAKSLSTSHDSLPTSLVTAINTVNTQFSTSITAADTASFINTAKTNKINDLKTKTLAQIVGSDWNLANFLVDTVSSEITTSWGQSNSFINGIKTIYSTTNSADVTSDLTALKTALQAELTSEATDLTNGGYAIAVAYLKNELKSASSYTTTHTGQIHKVTAININSINLPLEAFTWTATRSTVRTSPSEIEVDYSSQGSSGTATLTGKFNPTYSAFAGLSAFNNVVLVEKDFTYTITSGGTGGGGGVIPSEPVTLVDSTIVKDPVELVKEVNDQVAASDSSSNSALTVAQQIIQDLLTVSVDFVRGVSDTTDTLTYNLDQLPVSYFQQLQSRQELANEPAVKAVGVGLKPALVLNASFVGEGKITISTEMLKTLATYEVGYVELKVRGGSVKVSLEDLDQTKPFTINIGEPDLDEIPQRVFAGLNYTGNFSILTTITFDNFGIWNISKLESLNAATSAAALASSTATAINPDHLVVAMVEGDKLTYIGGKYNKETGTMQVNINEAGTYVVVERQVSFKDSGKLSWATAAINRGASKGFFQGRGNDTFDVSANVTKAEFIAMLLRTQNITATEDAKKALKYADVNKEQWYYTIAAAAVANGIVSAEDKQFNPNQIITREEMATLAANFLENVLFYNKNLTEVNVFKVDEKLIDPAHLQNVNFLASEGLVKGKAAGTFDPKGKVTRAEAAVIVDRIFGL